MPSYEPHAILGGESEALVMRHGWNGGGWDFGGWVLMGFMMLVFWGLVIGVIFGIFRSRAGTNPAAPSSSQAMHLLEERFARGEIDADEFAARRDLLRPK
jgi:putative membrane protein